MADAPMDQKFHWDLGNRFAIEGLRGLLLLNGGFAIASLFAAPAVVSFFAFGVVCTICAFLTSYLTQLFYGNASERAAHRCHFLTYALVALGLGALCLGLEALS